MKYISTADDKRTIQRKSGAAIDLTRFTFPILVCQNETDTFVSLFRISHIFKKVKR